MSQITVFKFARQPHIIYRQFKWYVCSLILTAAALSVNEFIIGVIVSNLLTADDLAVITLTMPIWVISYALSAFVGDGFGSIYGKSIGEMSKSKANLILSLSIYIISLLTVLFVAFGYHYSDALSVLLSGSQYNLINKLSTYLPYMFIAIGCTMLLSTLAKFLTQSGEPILATKLLVIANIISVLMVYILIKFWGYGIDSAAIAIIVGYSLSLLLLVAAKLLNKVNLTIMPVKFADLRVLQDGLGIGCFAALMFILLLFQIYGMNMLAVYGGGQAGIVINSVCLGINSIFFVMAAGFIETMVPMLSVMRGAQDIKAQQFIIKQTYYGVLLIVGSMTVLVELFPYTILDLYGLNNAEFAPLAIYGIRVYALGMFVNSLVWCFQNQLALYQHNLFNNLISVLKNVVLILPIGWILVNNMGINGLWLAYLFANLTTLLIVILFNTYLARQSQGQLQTILLLPQLTKEAPIFDFSINCTNATDIVNLSQWAIGKVRSLGFNDKTATLVGLAIEEMGLVIKEFNNQQEQYMDVLIENNNTQLTVTFRDIGKPLNLLDYPDEEDISSIKMLKILAKNICYERILMMNSHSFVITND